MDGKLDYMELDKHPRFSVEPMQPDLKMAMFKKMDLNSDGYIEAIEIDPEVADDFKKTKVDEEFKNLE